MTVQVNSQPVTDQIVWYIDMCFINNSISCFKKKTTFGTHEQTCYVDFNVCQNPTVCLSVSLEITRPELMGRPLVALVYIYYLLVHFE